jgi:hypothetical protein
LKKFKDTIHFEDFTPELFRRFVLYLRNERGNAESSIRKVIKGIEVYINEAIRRGYMKENPVKQIKLRGYQESNVVALDEDEHSGETDYRRANGDEPGRYGSCLQRLDLSRHDIVKRLRHGQALPPVVPVVEGIAVRYR